MASDSLLPIIDAQSQFVDLSAPSVRNNQNKFINTSYVFLFLSPIKPPLLYLPVLALEKIVDSWMVKLCPVCLNYVTY